MANSLNGSVIPTADNFYVKFFSVEVLSSKFTFNCLTIILIIVEFLFGKGY